MSTLSSNLVSFESAIKNRLQTHTGSKPNSQSLELHIKYIDPCEHHKAETFEISKLQLQQIVEEMDALHSQITAIIQH